MSTATWGTIKSKEGKPVIYKNSGEGKSQDLFLKLPEGKHRIRLVGQPHDFYLAWIQTPDGKREKYLVPRTGGYFERIRQYKGFDVKHTFATNCFYLEDSKVRIRILEKQDSSTCIFNNFITWYENFKYPEGHAKAGESINPGGPDGPVWLIESKAPEGKNSNQRVSYVVTTLQQTPFTKAQAEIIARNNAEQHKDLPMGERGIINLQEFYDEEKAKERLEKKLNELAGISVEAADDLPETASQPVKNQDIANVIGVSSPETKTAPAPAASKASDESQEDISNRAAEVLSNLF